jgi:hypothetical protein
MWFGRFGIWAPPKCKIFSWLIIQNRFWTCDWFARRGWPNGGICPLCRQQNETACHILFKCCYSVRIWNLVKDWLGIVDFEPHSWLAYDEVEDWWTSVAFAHDGRRKSIASLLMHVT